MFRQIALLLGIAALFVIGCASSQIRFTQDEIKEYPVETQEHIIKSEIVPGMTPRQVRYAWGAPDEVNFSNTTDGKPQEVWTYSSIFKIFKSRLTFIDGTLTAIVSSEPGRVK